MVTAVSRVGEGGKRVSKVRGLRFEDGFLLEDVGKRSTDFHVWEACVLRD